MTIRRVVPNLKRKAAGESRDFYAGFLGFSVGMDMGWIMTFVSPLNPTAQVTLLETDPSGIDPDLSVEVADVDDLHAKAVARGLKIVYPLTDEPWGVRRFFVVDPNGKVLNVMSHHERA